MRARAGGWRRRGSRYDFAVFARIIIIISCCPFSGTLTGARSSHASAALLAPSWTTTMTFRSLARPRVSAFRAFRSRKSPAFLTGRTRLHVIIAWSSQSHCLHCCMPLRNDRMIAVHGHCPRTLFLKRALALGGNPRVVHWIAPLPSEHRRGWHVPSADNPHATAHHDLTPSMTPHLRKARPLLCFPRVAPPSTPTPTSTTKTPVPSLQYLHRPPATWLASFPTPTA